MICIFILLLVSLISIWAPWMSEDFVEKRIIAYYENDRSTDVCSIRCDDCGIVSYEKKFFGANVVANVRCGAKISDWPPSDVYPTVNNFGFVDFRNVN